MRFLVPLNVFLMRMEEEQRFSALTAGLTWGMCLKEKSTRIKIFATALILFP
jgi:hypothetical protein